MPSDERALATWLATREDAALADILAARGVSPAAPWQDFFDAAEALLDAASLDRALTTLPRAALAALAGSPAAPPDHAVLTGRALVDDEGRPFAAVRDRVAALRAAEPAAFEPTPAAEPFSTADEQSAAAAAERVFTTSGALADVLLSSLATPLTRTGTGTVSAADRKRLIESGAVDTAEELDDLVALAVGADLAATADRTLIVTERAQEWLESPTPDRWRVVAIGFRNALPRGLRTATGGWLPAALWPSVHPLDPAWPERAAQLRRVGERWGLIDDAGHEPPWARPLREGGEPDTATLAPHLPAEIDRVYLQADLSAIAPGPLAPALDLRLRRSAVRESRAQASTYRFTADSITTGLTEGETAETLRAFLADISLTGIPQPLEYLIESTAARHGAIRVATDAASGRTRITSGEPSLLDAVAVDQALRPLGLVEHDGELTSRVSRDAVYWALADARYPVIALDAAGTTEQMHRRTAVDAHEPAADPSTAYRRLIGALRSGHADDGDGAWLQRELEQWVRVRAEIVVVVRMPDGSERPLTLEATGLGGGRLRGRDRGADIERTLPVSSIVSARPA